MFLDCSTPDDVLRAMADRRVEMVDVRFTDLPGLWQHFSVPPGCLKPDTFTDGIGFDGSSLRGFREIPESDMLVVPDPDTAFLDPFTVASTLVLILAVVEPTRGQAFGRNARPVATRQETYSQGSYAR